MLRDLHIVCYHQNIVKDGIENPLGSNIHDMRKEGKVINMHGYTTCNHVRTIRNAWGIKLLGCF